LYEKASNAYSVLKENPSRKKFFSELPRSKLRGIKNQNVIVADVDT